jgi:hypothetical protein
VMRELEGQSYEEIGLRLGASDGAVRQLLNRARRSLREKVTALVPMAPLVRWALASDVGSGVGRILAPLGGSALTAKATGAAVISAVSVSLLPSLHGPPVSGGAISAPDRGRAPAAVLATKADSRTRPFPRIAATGGYDRRHVALQATAPALGALGFRVPSTGSARSGQLLAPKQRTTAGPRSGGRPGSFGNASVGSTGRQLESASPRSQAPEPGAAGQPGRQHTSPQPGRYTAMGAPGEQPPSGRAG